MSSRLSACTGLCNVLSCFPRVVIIVRRSLPLTITCLQLSPCCAQGKGGRGCGAGSCLGPGLMALYWSLPVAVLHRDTSAEALLQAGPSVVRQALSILLSTFILRGSRQSIEVTFRDYSGHK